MTHIQQVLYELETPYMGQPYHVTGHALYNALARRVDRRTRKALQVSHGVFVPGSHGALPATHSHAANAPYIGTSLWPVERYADLFLFRDPAQRWLTDVRPREATNTVDLQVQGGRWTYQPTTRFGQPPQSRRSYRTVTWYLHCYLHAGRDDGGIIPLAEDTLDGLRVGGGRNYGCGELSLEDTLVVDLEELTFPQLERAQADEVGFQLELLSPYVLASEFPGADDQSIPWWWDTEEVASSKGESPRVSGLRRRETRLVAGEKEHVVETADHGQVLKYAGDDPIETAINGLRRVGTHAKYGFGEFRVRPADTDRVPARSDGDRAQHTAPASGGDRA